MPSLFEAARDGDFLALLITRQIEEEIERAVDLEMADLRNRIEQRVRSVVGSVATRIFDQVDVNHNGRFLTISVKIDAPKKEN